MFNSRKIRQLEAQIEYMDEQISALRNEVHCVKGKIRKFDLIEADQVRYTSLINLGKFNQGENVSVGTAISLIVKHLGLSFVGKSPPKHDPVELVPMQNKKRGDNDEL